MSKPTFGISIEPTWNQRYCIALARHAEHLGFSNVWVPDGGPVSPFSDTIVTLAGIASNTKKIKFGSAILNFYTRNPAQIASSFLALSNAGFADEEGPHAGSKSRRRRSEVARKQQQRAILGIGLGSDYNVARIGIFSRRAMVENLREAVESIQELLAGKEVSVRTDSFAIERVKLSKSARGRIPIYIGSTSPKGLRLAGEIVDGAILVERIAGEIKEAMTHIELGLASSSRSRKEFEVVNSVVISITDDKRRAQNAARANCAYLAAWLGEDTSIKYGINEEKRKEIARHINEGDESGAARLVDQRMIELLTVSGTAEECVEKCREHLSQGIDQIAFCEPFGPSDKAAALSLIAKKVIPKL